MSGLQTYVIFNIHMIISMVFGLLWSLCKELFFYHKNSLIFGTFYVGCTSSTNIPYNRL